MLILLSLKNRVEVKIAGKDYAIIGTEPEEYIHKVGLYVDRKMAEIMRGNNKLSTSMAAVLTAMNVADDFVKAHENEALLRKELKRNSEELQQLREEKARLSEENTQLKSESSNLQLELAKREAELKEVRNTLEKGSYLR
jgi:cell division protein ZapA